jgi:hypothetical protein
MITRALANASPGSPDGADVSIAATFKFSNGTPITISSGSITKEGVNFAITAPIVLGSVSDFIQWLHDKFKFPDINSQILALQTEVEGNPLLSDLYGVFMSFYNGIITITTLSIYRTKDAYSYKLSVTLDLNPPINFFDVIEFDSIGIAVNKSGLITSSPPTRR